MKNQLLLLVLLSSTLTLFAQERYYVQVGVYDQRVPAYQFSDLNSRVYYGRDAYDFHRYYIGPFAAEEADAKMADLGSTGRRGLAVVGESEFGGTCCAFRMRPREISGRLRSIFFDFDRSNIRPDAAQRLNQLVNTMREEPEYRVLLRAHTDAKGTSEYNERLSERRANAAKRYLTARGVRSSRISTETYGQRQPIAKNELADGSDTETGRQLNRRVEILLLDPNGEVVNAVEAIDVPADLRN